eukprot:4808341-Prymnesium_polylepis.1
MSKKKKTSAHPPSWQTNKDLFHSTLIFTWMKRQHQYFVLTSNLAFREPFPVGSHCAQHFGDA